MKTFGLHLHILAFLLIGGVFVASLSSRHHDNLVSERDWSSLTPVPISPGTPYTIALKSSSTVARLSGVAIFAPLLNLDTEGEAAVSFWEKSPGRKSKR